MMNIDISRIEANPDVRVINQLAKGLLDSDKDRLYTAVANLMEMVGEASLGSLCGILESLSAVRQGEEPEKIFPEEDNIYPANFRDYLRQQASKYREVNKG